jgi:hypothetical protein
MKREEEREAEWKGGYYRRRRDPYWKDNSGYN